MSHRRFTTFAWSVLGYNLLVILWGAYVRATGSGAGCGSHWPLCNGEVIPRAPSTETLIEYSHRLTSGVALLLVVGLLVFARRLFPAGHPARLGAFLSFVFMLSEAAIGAGLVLLELVAGNESLARAGWMGAHLVNTFLLLGALTLTAHWAGGGAPVRPGARRGLLGPVIWAVLATLLIGMTGAVAALGNTLFPATSLGEELRRDLAFAGTLLKQLRVLHPVIAVLGSLLLFHLVSVVRAAKPPRAARRWATALSFLVLIQLAVGSLNVVLLAPVPMQLVHLLLADLLWIVLVLTAATALAVPVSPEEPRCDRSPASSPPTASATPRAPAR